MRGPYLCSSDCPSRNSLSALWGRRGSPQAGGEGADLDDLFLAQCSELLRREAEQLAINRIGVCAEQRGGGNRHFGAAHLDWPARHLEVAAHRMFDGGEDFPAVEVGLVCPFQRVHTGAYLGHVRVETVRDLHF